MDERQLREALTDAASRYEPDVRSARRFVAMHQERPSPRGSTRRTWGAALLAGVLVVGVAVFAFVVLGDTSDDAPTSASVGTGPSAPVGTANLSDLNFFDASNGLALDKQCVAPGASDASCELQVVATSDGGTTWTPVSEPLHVGYPGWRGYPFVQFATNGKDGWIYGKRTFATHDGGNTFVEEDLGGTVVSLSMGPESTWMVVNPCAPAQQCASSVYTTPTVGGTATPLTGAPQLQSFSVELLRPSRDHALLSASGSGALSVTVDAGRTWVSRTMPPLCGQLHHVSAVTPQDVFVVCSNASPTRAQDKELYTSDDDGASWSLVSTSGNGGSLPEEGLVALFVAVSPDQLWMSFNRGPLIGSQDGGATWASAMIPELDATDDTDVHSVQQLTFSNASRGWAVVPPDLYRTTDGITWKRVGGA